MKFGCPCGNAIHDGTDFLPHKGHVIPDEDFFSILDNLDALLDRVASRGKVEEADYMAVRQRCSTFRKIYQCTHCARVFLWDKEIEGAYSFRPEDDDVRSDLLRGNLKNAEQADAANL